MNQPFMETSAAGTPVEPPSPLNMMDDLEKRLAAMVEARVSGLESAYDAKIKAMEERHAEELRAARGAPSVDHMVPFHAGGLGTEIAQVWSQHHQDLARAGQLTETILRDARGLPPVAA